MTLIFSCCLPPFNDFQLTKNRNSCFFVVVVIYFWVPRAYKSEGNLQKETLSVDI